MATNPLRHSEPGPFLADQIRDGDHYELSNGHPIECMSAGQRHATGNIHGAKALATDPAVKGAGVDLGIEWNEGKNLRAPDIVIGDIADEPTWMTGVPPLVVEYADRGQDEVQLREKIEELLQRGVGHIWVVRLKGPLRVEVYEPGKEMRVVGEDGVLSAPGALANTYSVRDLVDAAASDEATLRNLLNRKGYLNVDDVLARGHKEGQIEGKAAALLTFLQARGLPVSEAVRGRVQACKDGAVLDRWIARAAVAASTEEAIE